MNSTIRYIWQCYSGPDDIFYNPRIKPYEESFELWFDSPEQARQFKEAFPKEKLYELDDMDDWVLCKLTIEACES